MRRTTIVAGCTAGLLLATAVQAAESPAAPPVAAQPACTVLYTQDDQRLFDFIGTRGKIDFRAYQGRAIGHITFLTLPIFNPDDPDENNAIYRFANRIHILTRDRPIRKQVLFREGDRLDEDRIRETERILRADKFLYDAMVLPAADCGDAVDLLVVVRDIWTLQPSASFSRRGGENKSGVGITDENILGYGHSLNVSFKKTAQRSGLVFGYENQHLLDGHTALGLDHSNNSDGHFNAVSLERPFYALDTPWSAGFSWHDELLRDSIEAGGVVNNEYDLRNSGYEIYYGMSEGVRNNTAHRIRFGFTRASNTYSNQGAGFTRPLPDDKILAYPWVEYSSVDNAYWTTSNYSQMFRNEDIGVGTRWQARVGLATRATGSTESDWISGFSYDNTLSFAGHHLVQNGVSGTLQLNIATQKAQNTLLGYSLNYDRFINERDRWYATLKYDTGWNLDEDNELVAGGDTGMRGYPNRWQRGDQRAVLNIERRHFYNVHILNLVRIGSAAFVDAGKAWNPESSIEQSDRVLVDAGIGMRLSSSKARADHVVHVNLAFPLVDRKDAGDFQWSVFAEQKF